MLISPQLSLSATKDNMHRLVIIRLIAVFGQIGGILFAYHYLHAMVNYSALITIVLVMSVLLVLTIIRLRAGWGVTDVEYFFQLLVDVTGLTLLLYFSGGSTNPFISYYLVLLTISAATLPWAYTWIMLAITFVAYSLLIIYYQPLHMGMSMVMEPLDVPGQGHHVQGHMNHEQNSFFNLHITGMWITFVISAYLITYFVVKMAKAIRTQDQALAESRESLLHDEQLLAVATLAAGTAHELGTPLSTISVLVKEMQSDNASNAHLQKDLDLLEQQVEVCKASLQGMVSKTEISTAETGQIIQVTEFVERVRKRWEVLRPDVKSHFQVISEGDAPHVFIDETVDQALLNVLNNAGDASPQKVDIQIRWDEQTMMVNIRDYGSGIPPEIAQKLGKPFITNKGKGLGLGLFLSHATIERFNGQISLRNHKEGGTETELRLPVHWTKSKEYP